MRMVGREWGRRVRQRREHLGLTQAEVAIRAGVRQASVSLVESGKMRPNDHLKVRLAAALHIAPGDLFAWPEKVA